MAAAGLDGVRGDGFRGTYHVDATVRATTQPSPQGSNQDCNTSRQVALDPRIVASVSVRAVNPGVVPSALMV